MLLISFNRKILSLAAIVLIKCVLLVLLVEMMQVDLRPASSVLALQHLLVDELLKHAQVEVLLRVERDLLDSFLRDEGLDPVVDPLGESSAVDDHHLLQTHRVGIAQHLDDVAY